MSATDPYLQFPLCALAFGKSEDERLNAILDYGTLDAGEKLWANAMPETKERFVASLKQGRKLPTGFHRELPSHVAALFGAASLNVEYADIRTVLEGHQILKAYVAEFERCHGRSPLVRIKLAWWFKARDHKGLTFREFSVLCAIYSCIGDKKAAQITQERIRRCALGYKTAPVMEDEIDQRTDGARPLTERQLRDTITRLHRNQFFARCTYGRRITYYSIRASDAALRELVLKRHTRADKHRLDHAAKDKAMTDAILRARRNKCGMSVE